MKETVRKWDSPYDAQWRHLTGYCTNSISMAFFLDLGVAKICLPHLGHYQHSAEQSFDVKHTLPKLFLGCKKWDKVLA